MLTPKDAYDALLTRNRLGMDDATELGRAPLRWYFDPASTRAFLLRVALAVSTPLPGLQEAGKVSNAMALAGTFGRATREIRIIIA